jgi:hypothetical protein
VLRRVSLGMRWANRKRRRSDIAVPHGALYDVARVDFEHVLRVPDAVGGATRLRPTLYC